MNYIKKTLITLSVSLGLLSQSTFAESSQSNTPLAQLKKEINLQLYKPAWQTAQTLKDEYLGEPSFDFLYGVAALANNQAEHAVFAFERVTANQPDWLDAQYLLAKSNYEIANYQVAINSSKLLLKNPSISAKLKTATNTLIDLSQTQLNKQSVYLTQRISLSLGQDSNINSGTTEDDIFLPFIDETIALSQASKEIRDNYASLSYQASGSKKLSQVSKITFLGQGTIHQFQEETDYNRILADVAVKYQHVFDVGQLSFGVKVAPLWLDSALYRTRTALTVGFEKQLTNNLTLTTEVIPGQTNNQFDSAFDSNYLALNFSAHYFSSNMKHSLGFNYFNEKSKNEVYEHTSNILTTLSYSNLWLINHKWLASGMIAFQQKDYQDLHPFFLEERNDDMLLASLKLQYSLSNKWSLSMNVNAQDKDSNLTLFSYQRSDFSLTANMNF